MDGWKTGSSYPDVRSLADVYHRKTRESLGTMAKHLGAAAALIAAIYFASRSWPVLAAGAITLALIVLWAQIRRNKYRKMAEIIASGEFSWTVAKLQGKHKRSYFDISVGPSYQIMVKGEWIASDASTYRECPTGEPVVLINIGEEAVGVPIPKGVGWKTLKAAARA